MKTIKAFKVKINRQIPRTRKAGDPISWWKDSSKTPWTQYPVIKIPTWEETKGGRKISYVDKLYYTGSGKLIDAVSTVEDNEVIWYWLVEETNV